MLLIDKGNLWQLDEWMRVIELVTINGLIVGVPGYCAYMIFNNVCKLLKLYLLVYSSMQIKLFRFFSFSFLTVFNTNFDPISWTDFRDSVSRFLSKIYG